MITDQQAQIIRQSSLKASIEYLKLVNELKVKCNEDWKIDTNDVLEVASIFGRYCATGTIPKNKF
tara:strand:- start:1776 stop:1970 length:195 start_codon:yes stop_codon:yes gene_type:complete